MCYQGKCFNSISIKTTCFVAAIVNVAVSGILALFYLFIWGVIFEFHISLTRDDIFRGAFINIIIMLLASILNIIFCSVLISGICNRRPKQIKAYFWFGTVLTILAFGYAVTMLIIVLQAQHARSELSVKVMTCWWFGCVLHSLFLVLVYFTHKKLLKDNRINSENSQPPSHQRLLKV